MTHPGVIAWLAMWTLVLLTVAGCSAMVPDSRPQKIERPSFPSPAPLPLPTWF